MPYKHDTRRTVTLNLPAKEYATLAEEALEAGYATPGTYALALVRARGEAPPPIYDQQTRVRIHRLEGAQVLLLHQVEAWQAQLRQAGLTPTLVSIDTKWAVPRTPAAQQRAVEQAVREALQQERQRVARQAATAGHDSFEGA